MGRTKEMLALLELLERWKEGEEQAYTEQHMFHWLMDNIYTPPEGPVAAGHARCEKVDAEEEEMWQRIWAVEKDARQIRQRLDTLIDSFNNFAERNREEHVQIDSRLDTLARRIDAMLGSEAESHGLLRKKDDELQQDIEVLHKMIADETSAAVKFGDRIKIQESAQNAASIGMGGLLRRVEEVERATGYVSAREAEKTRDRIDELMHRIIKLEGKV